MSQRKSIIATVLSVAAVVLLAVLIGSAIKRSLAPKPNTAKLDFNRDVQPILASNCFSCHGPDPGNRKAGLRLDLEEYAFRKRQGKPDAIVPGHPDRSELIRRIESTNPHQLMPQSPLGEAKPMKPEEIAILKRWVAEGAVYQPHWAFGAPARPAAPDVKEKGWAKTPIDTFVEARLEKEGLHPAPEADKATLIRRVTLDLTGLLPTPAEVAAFESDTSPNAYEHLVDGLLAKPAFGEERTRYWLDYARYADTYGLHFDNSRHAWPYRDYLIRSFNANKPFDQFAMEQIAGDMMPAKDLDPLIASGYVRAGISSNEGGTIPEELRVNIARERTEAYGAAFLGLTVGCAVCHDHKYDPTTQKDFYALSAFFNNIDEQPFNLDKPHWAPVVRIPSAQRTQAYNQLVARRSDLVSQRNVLRAHAKEAAAHWMAESKNPPQAVAPDKLDLRLRLDEGGGDVLKNSAPKAVHPTFAIGKTKPAWGENTWLWPDFRMESATRVMLDQTGNYEWNQAFSSGGWFMLRSAPNFSIAKSASALIAKMDANDHNRGWDLSIEKGVITVNLIDEVPKDQLPPGVPAPKMPVLKPVYAYPIPADLDTADPGPVKAKLAPPIPKDPVKEAAAKKAAAEKAKKDAEAFVKDPTPNRALRVTTLDPLPLDGNWQHIFFTYDGSGKAAGIKVYVNGAAVPTKVVADTLHGASILTQAPMQLGWRYPDKNPAKETRYQDIRLYARTLSPAEAKRLPFEDYVAEIAHKPAAQWTADETHVVSEFYLHTIDTQAKELDARITQVERQLDATSEGGDISIVAWEKPSIPYADVLARGVYSARAERVEANTPHFLPALQKDQPHNRLALAKWTVSLSNPLTARVTVNRMWNELFGAGLVETTEDFGIMGQRPSHPELLDWLAVEFRESGWDIKHMYKLMVMSETYRQSAHTDPAVRNRDPKNLLLARGPRFRMDAEMLRDIALQSSGLLVPKIGGPSVKTYQPPNVWEVGYPTSDTTHYTQDHGDALYRRSMYTYWKRMAMQPDMDAFDAPSRDTVCTRRQRTDTPLQALVTMNDPQWVEAARVLAERLMKEAGPQPAQKITYLHELLLAHSPPPATASILLRSFDDMRKHYTADPKAAAALIHVGEKPPNPSLSTPELAAWTMVVSEAFNLDETLNK